MACHVLYIIAGDAQRIKQRASACMHRATFERFCAFVAVFAQAFDASRAHHVIGTERFWELRLELTELAKRADQASAHVLEGHGHAPRHCILMRSQFRSKI